MEGIVEQGRQQIPSSSSWAHFSWGEGEEEEESGVPLEPETATAARSNNSNRSSGSQDEQEEPPLSEFLAVDGPRTPSQAQEHQHQQHSNQEELSIILDSSMPPIQLHPSISAEMRRISSCFLSLDGCATGGTSGDNDSASGNGGSNNNSRSGSVADLLSLFEDAVMMESYHHQDKGGSSSNGQRSDEDEEQAACSGDGGVGSGSCSNGGDGDGENEKLPYHDILMNVFGYLDKDDLAAFSETARRPNFECFYYLQLRLQRALAAGTTDDGDTANNKKKGKQNYGNAASDDDEDGGSGDDDGLRAPPSPGIGCLVRLRDLDRPEAEATVQEFLDSNTSLGKGMLPLTYSLAHMRQVLLSQLLDRQRMSNPQAAALASGAAFLFAMLGAASAAYATSSSGATTMMSTSAADISSALSMMMEDLPTPSSAELSNVLFKVGCLGSLMKAAKTMSESDRAERLRLAMMRHRQEQEERHIQQQQQQQQQSESKQSAFSFSILRLMHAAYSAAYGDQQQQAAVGGMTPSSSLPAETESASTTTYPSSPNPYEHVPPSPARRGKRVADTSDANSGTADGDLSHFSAGEDVESDDGDSDLNEKKEEETAQKGPRKVPSGCVGAYTRALHRANSTVRDRVKRRRKSNYESLPPERRREVSSAFIDACCSDDNLELVEDMVRVEGIVDVDGFYVGSDGTETCGLHSASFHGSCRILEFLCRGIDESDPGRDGGLCDVNRTDGNGWTACHFAAGANSVRAVEILALHGADLSVEAANGYTPLQWAERLQHHQVADEIRKRSGSEHQLRGWMSRQPLSAIASRFLAMIPSH